MHYVAMVSIFLLIVTYNKERYRVWNDIVFTVAIFYLAWFYLGF